MGEAVSNGSELDLSKPMAYGKKRDDGHWVDLQGISLPVSASDLERHTYCPCLLYTSPSPRDRQKARMPSSA